MKRKIAILTFTFICTLGIQAQNKLEKVSNKEGINELLRLDLNILSLFPTKDDYKNFKNKIENLPLDYIKHVDSIDYSKFDKNYSLIQIYSQNRVYKSRNVYEIKKNPKNDSLIVKNINLDMKIKDYIIDYDAYTKLNIEYNFILKKVIDKRKMNRIIFSKPQISELLNQEE